MNDSTNSQPQNPIDQQPVSPDSLYATLGTLTQSHNFQKIKDFLDANSNLTITKIKDNRSYSVLHTACVGNKYEIGKLFVDYAKSNLTPKDELVQWINARTDEGFTAIHFASFKGNVKLIQLLEENGADYRLKNNKGLTVVHTAAQGDRPAALAYWKEKGMNLYEKDNNGSTPLHWAGYFGMENSAFYLTVWGANPNQLDDEFKCTPLHLAANSGNFKLVKRLLAKGADKTIKNGEGKLPIEIATENEHGAIVDLLETKHTLAHTLGLKTAIVKKRTLIPLYFVIFSFLLITTMTVLFIFPYIYDPFWMIFIGILTALMYATFLSAWLKDPGYVQNKEKGDLLKLLTQNDPKQVCPECIVVRPERSKHCEYCGSCVSVYDHHCPWINNCIGAKNYASFIRFIVTMLITMIALLVFSCFHVAEKHVYYPILPISEDVLFILKAVTCAVIIMFTLCFTFPLFTLNYLHVVNLVTGKTTHERFAFSENDDSKSKHQVNQSQSTAPQSLNSLQESLRLQRRATTSVWFGNCKSMCFTNAKTERYKSTTIELL